MTVAERLNRGEAMLTLVDRHEADDRSSVRDRSPMGQPMQNREMSLRAWRQQWMDADDVMRE